MAEDVLTCVVRIAWCDASLLVETGFISNPTEEKRLRDPAHQQKLAASLMKGLRRYFYEMPPPGTYLASQKTRQHVISRGETLSLIAQQYQVSLSSLRSANGIAGDRIRVGQVLRIPGG